MATHLSSELIGKKCRGYEDSKRNKNSTLMLNLGVLFLFLGRLFVILGVLLGALFLILVGADSHHCIF